MRKIPNEELNRLNPDDYKKAPKNPIMVVLDNIRSLNNIGSVFRTADAFLIESISLCGITAKPPHREIQKTALGATETVAWSYFEDTQAAIKDARARGFEIVLIEQVDGATMLQDFRPHSNKKYAFVFGNEINGISENILDKADFCIEIPQFGTKHSFNISVSAGIILWHTFLHLRK